MMKSIGIVAALPDEAKCFYKKSLICLETVTVNTSITLCLTGMGKEAALAGAKKLHERHNVQALLNWGVAGGVNDRMSAGDCILPDNVYFQGEQYPTHDDWRLHIKKVTQSLSLNWHTGSLMTVDHIIATNEDKKDCQKHGVAVDMESGAVAQYAKQHDLAFMVIRSISDDQITEVPEVVLKHTDNLLRIKLLPFMFGLLMKPQQISQLITLHRDYKKGINSLNMIAPMLMQNP